MLVTSKHSRHSTLLNFLTLYAVPSFKTEWYWWQLDGAKDPETVAFHNRVYGPNFKYAGTRIPEYLHELCLLLCVLIKEMKSSDPSPHTHTHTHPPLRSPTMHGRDAQVHRPWVRIDTK